MKTTYPALLIIAGLFSLTFITNSCAKADHSADLPKEQQVVGKWSINRIQLRLYSGTTFVKDTILPNVPKPENFVRFDSYGKFEYRFNKSSSDLGTYEFPGPGSLTSNSAPISYNWTMLTLTNVLFTVVSKGTDPAFPGYIVERYQTFVR